MKIAMFDPFSGASGDMILGALVSAGADLASIQREFDGLGLPVRLEATPVGFNAVNGLRVNVIAADDAHSRTWRDIRTLIERSSLKMPVKTNALAIFANLAHAEATVHATGVDEVHFHEVGGLDAIADICGACIALDLLGIERVYSGPLRTGSGFVRAAHGLLPVPAPATAELLVSSGAPVSTGLPPGADSPGELLTPTGAAILTTLALFAPVSYLTLGLGYGFGTRELPWPNALRVWIGETGDAAGGELLMETNIDDMNPQQFEILTERLFAAGAFDVWLTPIVMKKGRPATKVSALLPAGLRGELETIFIMNSTTLGVRVSPVDRTRAARRFEQVTTRWGEVTVKLRGWRGRVIDAAPEYDECARIARAADVPIREVWNEAHRSAEPFLGRRIEDSGEWA
jgi:pyridinium-3,5-bisthiocarboxylic acid mononucleotide nickel chelatase